MTPPRKTRVPKNPAWKGYALAAIGLVVVAGIVGVGWAAQQGSSTANTTAGAQPQASSQPVLDMSRRVQGDPTAMGRVDAPVVLIEYADFRCPFCGVYARDTLPKLVAEYVKSGQMRIEWRDFPVFGQESVDAAVAARAAGKQGKFWEFSAAVYADAPARGHVALPREKLIAIGKQIGVPDMAAYERDLTDPALLDLVNKDVAEGRSLGVNGTPTFLVNDTPLSGAQPIDVFRAAIDAQLKKAHGG